MKSAGNLLANNEAQNEAVRYILPLLSVITIAGAATPARADVMQLGADGGVTWRRHGGSVAWQNETTTVGEELHAAPMATSLPSTPISYAPALQAAAHGAGISPQLLEALIWQESRWHAGAVSPKGAIGLGQLMPATARALGVNPRDPFANLQASARYLRQQIDLFGGNVELALAAYNAGPGRVQRAGGVPAIAETRAYVRSITSRLNANLAGLAQGNSSHAQSLFTRP